MLEEQEAISRIAVLREEKGLTQLELSRQVGVTETTIQNWEKSRSGVEMIERVIKLCKALDCKPEELIEYILVSKSKKTESKGGLQKIRERLGTEQPTDALCDKSKSATERR